MRRTHDDDAAVLFLSRPAVVPHATTRPPPLSRSLAPTPLAGAFSLILRNLARVAAVRGVAFFVILVGKLLIAIGSGALMYVIAAEYYAEEIVSPLFPAIGSAMLGFGVASIVLGVLDTAAEARDVSSAEKRPSESDGRWCRCPNDGGDSWSGGLKPPVEGAPRCPAAASSLCSPVVARGEGEAADA